MFYELLDRAAQYQVGLISDKELQFYLDNYNRGSDYEYFTISGILALLPTIES